MEIGFNMKPRNLLNALSKQIGDLSKKIEDDISDLNLIDENLEKMKSQKHLIDNIHKITSIMMQIQKLEKLYEDEEEDLSNQDMDILNQFIDKIKSGR